MLATVSVRSVCARGLSLTSRRLLSSASSGRSLQCSPVSPWRCRGCAAGFPAVAAAGFSTAQGSAASPPPPPPPGLAGVPECVKWLEQTLTVLKDPATFGAELGRINGLGVPLADR
eukprot:RCo008460